MTDPIAEKAIAEARAVLARELGGVRRPRSGPATGGRPKGGRKPGSSTARPARTIRIASEAWEAMRRWGATQGMIPREVARVTIEAKWAPEALDGEGGA